MAFVSLNFVSLQIPKKNTDFSLIIHLLKMKRKLRKQNICIAIKPEQNFMYILICKQHNTNISICHGSKNGAFSVSHTCG